MCRLGKILFYTLARCIQIAHIQLSQFISLSRRLKTPLRRFGIILRDTQSLDIHIAKQSLRICIASPRQEPKISQRGIVISRVQSIRTPEKISFDARHLEIGALIGLPFP